MSINKKAKQVWEHYFGLGLDKTMDAFGLVIAKADYDNENSVFGWYIDHIRPKSYGGGDELSNLRPLSFRNNQFRNSHL